MTRASFDVAGVWDIECGSWDRFVVGRWRAADGESFESWDEADFFASIVARSGVWYAHAGGRYDVLWLLGQAAARRIPWHARLRGAGVLSVTIGEADFRDSFALVPMSLKKGAALGGVAKLEHGFACECGKACGGFCVLARPLAPHERRRLSEYLAADCEALWSMLEAVASRAASDGIELGLTIGATAWRTASAWLGLERSPHDLGRYRRLREGYYGGRVEVYRARAARGHRFDIHSSYPAALARVALPIGEPTLHASPAAAARAFSGGRPGIYGARLTVPRCDVPPLPVRMRQRLIYPVGPIEGIWTAPELAHAAECGARIDAVTWGYSWPAAARVLAPYAERVWALRDEAARAGEAAWSAWYKWLANSLTGKLGQRPEHAALRFVPYDAPMPDGELEVIRYASSGAYLRQQSTPRVDACAWVEWAAYLTSEARTELHRQLLSAERPIYCDTDSVYACDRLTRRVGDGLGEWGYEGALASWRALAPKVYAYDEPSTGERQVRGKGFPGLDGRGFDGLSRGETWEVSRGVHGARSALRSGERLFKARTLARSLHPVPGWIGGRLLAASTSASVAPTVAQYRARFERG